MSNTINNVALIQQVIAANAKSKKAAAATATKAIKPRGFLSNPAFDARIRNIPNWGLGANSAPRDRIGGIDVFENHGGPIFERGTMVTDQPVDGYFYALNFLYNPTTVSAQHSIDPSIVPPSAQSPIDITTPLIPLAQNVSFSLLFDRTFELWDSQYALTEVGQRGVQMDVIALYRMVGITAPPTIASKAAGGDGSATAGKTSAINSPAFFRPRGPMLQTAVRVNIGEPLSYYGFINSINLTYTHWNVKMVPQRCQCDIQLTLLVDASNNNAFGAVTADSRKQAFGNFASGQNAPTGPTLSGVGGR